jgi:hypothetical protein
MTLSYSPAEGGGVDPLSPGRLDNLMTLFDYIWSGNNKYEKTNDDSRTKDFNDNSK